MHAIVSLSPAARSELRKDSSMSKEVMSMRRKQIVDPGNNDYRLCFDCILIFES